MSAKHARLPSGLMPTPRSPEFEGRFGRLFRPLPPASFGNSDAENEENLASLGKAMSTPADPADPKVGKDDEESGIPSLYTYLGQFIDHDITFDPANSLQKQNDPDALVDFRSPAFDLDNVYGRGPDDEPYMYDQNSAFLLRAKLQGGDPKRTIARCGRILGFRSMKCSAAYPFIPSTWCCTTSCRASCTPACGPSSRPAANTPPGSCASIARSDTHSCR